MGDLMVETPATQVLPHRKQMPSSIPNIDSLEGLGTDGSDEYSTLKKLQRHLEYAYWTIRGHQLTKTQIHSASRGIHQGRAKVCRDINIRRQRLIHQRSLKRELIRAQEEIKRIQSVPLVIGQFMEAIDQK